MILSAGCSPGRGVLFDKVEKIGEMYGAAKGFSFSADMASGDVSFTVDAAYEKNTVSEVSVTMPEYMRGFEMKLTDDELVLALGEHGTKYKSSTALSQPGMPVLMAPMMNEALVSSDAELDETGDIVLSKSIEAGNVEYWIIVRVDGTSLFPHAAQISCDAVTVSAEIYNFDLIE